MSQLLTSNHTSLARKLCCKQLVKHFLWYKIGNESSSRLRSMESGSTFLNNLDRLYTYISQKQQCRIRKIDSKINDLGPSIAAFRWVCETIISGCKTERQLVTFAVIFLIVIVRMLERTEQTDLNDKADHISSILCDSMSNIIMELRDRKNLYMGLAMSCLTIGVCLIAQSLWNIICL